MSRIQSKVNTRSEEFLANAAHMESLVGIFMNGWRKSSRVAAISTRNGIDHAANCWCVSASMH